MSTTNITPSYALEIANRNKPAVAILSKANLIFNPPATLLLALKEGIKFILVEKDGKLYYKEVLNGDGFEIKTVLSQCARLNTSALLPAVLTLLSIKMTGKSLRFDIGSLHEGMRLLTLVEK